MQFIKGVIAPATTQGNLSASVNTVNDNFDVDGLNDVSSPISSLGQDDITTQQMCSNSNDIYSQPRPTSKTDTFANPQKSTRKRRATEQSEIDRYLEIEKQKIELLRSDQNKSSEPTQNPDYHFLMSLLPYFGEFEGIEKLGVRASIQNVIMEALKRKKQNLPLNHVHPVYSINVPISTNDMTNHSIVESVENSQDSTTYLFQSFDE
ncbi:unnamed protein product [Ceutorhynchus assimilis]|uniref:BESS domain-containing protein n=1 Tax=Ceutorhynchus assimilis TaxID=467358 RepID=A0A9N9N050_9CUCU|nr:unnamed protein product [Ceutorhynchus assimilis]